MLTANQEKLIENLKSEFQRMNSSQSKSSSLVQELLGEINLEEKSRDEMTAYNQQVFISLFEKLNKDIEDFKDLYDSSGINFDVTLNYSLEHLLERQSDYSLFNLTFFEFKINHLGNLYRIDFGLEYTTHNVGEIILRKIVGLKGYKSLIESTNENPRFRTYLKEILLNN